LNPHPNAVTDPVFQTGDFFDRDDLVQVKYEMLRRVTVDKQSVTQSATAFGFSRPTYYQAEADFMKQYETAVNTVNEIRVQIPSAKRYPTSLRTCSANRFKERSLFRSHG
jgi:hypothetical protein